MNPILDWLKKVSRATSLGSHTKRSHTHHSPCPCKQPGTHVYSAAEMGGQQGTVHLYNTRDSQNHRTSP